MRMVMESSMRTTPASSHSTTMGRPSQFSAWMVDGDLQKLRVSRDEPHTYPEIFGKCWENGSNIYIYICVYVRMYVYVYIYIYMCLIWDSWFVSVMSHEGMVNIFEPEDQRCW